MDAVTPAPKPTKQKKAKRKLKNPRKALLKEIDKMCRQLTIWRDGCVCVLSDVDGGRCDRVSQWGHVIPQGASGYLKHNLSNSFRQCATHNLLHRSNQAIYLNWYRHKFGSKAFDALTEESKKTYHKFTMADLEEIRDNLHELIGNTYMMGGATLEQLVDAGYYGSVIRSTWVAEGRI